MDRSDRLVNIVFFLSVFGIGIAGCTLSESPDNLQVMEAHYQSVLNGDGQVDVDTFRDVSSQLSTFYLDIVQKSPQSDSAPRYLYKAANLNEPNYMNPSRAIQLYQQLIDDYPQSPYRAEALFRLGYLYHNVLMNIPEAKKIFEQFIDTYPEHELVVSARSEIDNLGMRIDSTPRNVRSGNTPD